MSLARALRYSAREACPNLLRSWRVSLLAVLTITVSLLLGGAFLLASRNLAGSVEGWRGQLHVVIYLRPGTPASDLPRLAAAARAAPWVARVEGVLAAGRPPALPRALPPPGGRDRQRRGRAAAGVARGGAAARAGRSGRPRRLAGRLAPPARSVDGRRRSRVAGTGRDRGGGGAGGRTGARRHPARRRDLHHRQHHPVDRL